MIRFYVLGLTVLAIAGNVVAQTAPNMSEPIVLDPRFTIEKHWNDVGWAVALRMSKNTPDVFIAEKTGVIRWYASVDAGDSDFKTLIQLPAHHHEDRGLLGLAVHPDFPQQPFIYALYVDGFVSGRSMPLEQCPVNVFVDPNNIERCAAQQKLVRLTVDYAQKKLVSQSLMVQGWCTVGRSHSSGDLIFTADGSLLVSAGDGATYEAGADAGVRGDGCYDFQGPPLQGAFRSQHMQYLNGKILMIKPAALTAKDRGRLVRDEDYTIVARGLRNPYRMQAHPKTGDIYIGDVGASAVEEIDILPNPRKSHGPMNFGWPCNEGTPLSTEYQVDPKYVAFCTAESDRVPPWFEYSHAPGALPSPCEGPSSSPTGIAFYPGDAVGPHVFPQIFKNTMFWLEGSKRSVLFFENDRTGKPEKSKLHVFVNTPGTGDKPGQFVDIQFDRAGRMFLIDVFTSAVYRVTHNRV